MNFYRTTDHVAYDMHSMEACLHAEPMHVCLKSEICSVNDFLFSFRYS